MNTSPYVGIDIGNPDGAFRAASKNLGQAIRDEAYVHLRGLLRGEFNGFYPVKHSDDARRLLRIEVDRDQECNLMRYFYEAGIVTSHPSGDAEGPNKLDGIDVYVVSRLPAPGWRIVNPYNRKAD